MELSKLLFLLFQLIILVIQTSAQFEFLYNKCGTNFSTPSTYQTNLRNVLNSISSNTQITYGYYNFTAGHKPNKVDATVLCRADISVDACQLCASFSAATIQTVCLNTKQAFGYSENCTIYYTDTSAFHVLADRPFWALRYEENATDIPNFNSSLTKLMTALQNNASLGNSELKFATGKLNFSSNSNQTLYGLVQCSPDLSRLDCVKCVQNITLSVFPAYFVTFTDASLFMAKGGRVVSPSCFLRYELYPFYGNVTYVAEPSGQPPASPASNRNITSVEAGNSSKSHKIIVIVVPIVGSLVLIIIIASICILLKKKKPRKVSGKFNKEEMDTLDSLQFTVGAIKVSLKSDVFSFGVLVLEIISGQSVNSFHINKHSENLLAFTWKAWQEGKPWSVVDPALSPASTFLQLSKCLHNPHSSH
ncbi:hypothetical protein BVRB_9g210280 [Beta vulgaris subsp. vulgaris]|nr:hypothetical protein BVRB_9g210280 [Beta vulgaris subsp. vulgaris]